MATRYVNVDRQTPMLLPADMRDWVEEDDLVHFIIEVVEGLDLRCAAANERGTGSEQYPPGMMLGLLIYSYATGVFSSRRIERSTYTSVPVRYLCADTHPDHDTIAKFRRENLALVQDSFTQILGLARQMGLVNVGTVSIDGTKMGANASKRANVTAEQLQLLRAKDQKQVQGMLKAAEEADGAGAADATRLPGGLAGKAERQARLRAAQQVLAGRSSATRPQVNTTDPDSRMQPPSQPGGGFTQGYNAQAAVDSGPARLVVAARIADSPADQNQLEATAVRIPSQLGQIETIITDRGYDSHPDIVRTGKALRAKVLCPPSHFNPNHSSARGRRAALYQERAGRYLWAQSAAGRQLLRLRQTTVEPVFAMIKAAMGFRTFRLRGLKKVAGEWNLITLAYNMRRIWSSAQAI